MASNGYELIIYIPSYNRQKNLKDSLAIISREIKGYEDKVLVYVSNNGSSDGTKQYLDSLDYPWLQVRHNPENIGAPLNILHCFDLPIETKFVWPIGDDDYLMPGAISGLLDVIESYPEADYIFCNTTAFAAQESEQVMKTYLKTGSIGPGKLKSSRYAGTSLVYFEQLIDPSIADTLLCELMVHCFRQSSTRFSKPELEGIYLETVDWDTIDFETAGTVHTPQNLPFLHCFQAKTKAVYCDTARTFNFWGSAGWLSDYDHVFPVIILYLIVQYKEHGIISEEHFFNLLDYYYAAMHRSLLRQISGQSTARAFSPKIKARMFDYLLLYVHKRFWEAGQKPAGAPLVQAGNRARQAGCPSRISDLTTIIILTFNQLEYTKLCVESIRAYTDAPHDIIFVDNGSTDGSVEWLTALTKENPNYQLIDNKQNLGFAGGNNKGIAQAKGKYVLLLNNDVVVTEHWLESLIIHMEKDPQIGMIGPMSNSVSGPQMVQGVPYGDSLEAMHAYARDFAATNSNKLTENMRIVGFCLLIKKEVLDVIGNLDENYVSGNFEDDDLCLRSFIAGYKNVIAQDVFIHHFGSMTFKGNAIDYSATMQENRQYFATKWKDIVQINATGYQVQLTREQQLKYLLQWGEDKFSQENIQAAVRVFERVLALDKTNSQALSNLGVIQWQIGDTEAAIKTFLAALMFNPQDPDALSNLLHAVTETGMSGLVKPDLLEKLKQAQAHNPDLNALINACQGS